MPSSLPDPDHSHFQPQKPTHPAATISLSALKQLDEFADDAPQDSPTPQPTPTDTRKRKRETHGVDAPVDGTDTAAGGGGVDGGLYGEGRVLHLTKMRKAGLSVATGADKNAVKVSNV